MAEVVHEMFDPAAAGEMMPACREQHQIFEAPEKRFSFHPTGDGQKRGRVVTRWF
jgi:hypothetical protein